MSKFLLNKVFYEHSDNIDISECEHPLRDRILFQEDPSNVCISVDTKGNRRSLSSSYFIGCDWLSPGNVAVMVSPKLNKGGVELDYFRMLFSSLKHPDVLGYSQDLYEIKFEAESIELNHEQDFITPLLVTQYLQVLRVIVKKGLKLSYYRISRNLVSRVKGKIDVARTIKENVFRNKHSNTVCTYEHFGTDGTENRLLKRALLFCQSYLSEYPTYKGHVSQLVGYCLPAFDHVSDDTDLNELKSPVYNAFYREYTIGLKIAQLILRRFGYNLKNTESKSVVATPPFWINMSKLFELYVLGLLKDRYGNKLDYHFTRQYNELDFLLNTEEEKIIIDAKYKLKYNSGYDLNDIRQLSGYARIRKLYEHLGLNLNHPTPNIDCLIIYPNQDASADLNNQLKVEPIHQFVSFYKLGIRLPVIGDRL